MLWCHDTHGPHLEDDLSDGLLETQGLTERQLSQDIPKVHLYMGTLPAGQNVNKCVNVLFPDINRECTQRADETWSWELYKNQLSGSTNECVNGLQWVKGWHMKHLNMVCLM